MIETWRNYIKTIQMCDFKSGKIYSNSDKAVEPREINNINLLIDHHSHKKIVLKLMDNIDLFMTKANLNPNSIDMLFDKIVKVCVHYEMLDNLDNLMVILLYKYILQ